MTSNSPVGHRVVGLVIAGSLLLLGDGSPRRAESAPKVSAPAPAAAGPAHHQVIVSVAASPDGRWLATGSADPECTVVLWELAGAKPVHAFTGHPNTITTLAFSPDSRLLASASGLRSGRSNILVWDVSARALAWRADTGMNTLDAVAFSPDGRTLAGTGSNGAIQLWDAATGAAEPGLRVDFAVGSGRNLSWCPDGERLALVAGNYGYIVDRTTGRPLQTLKHRVHARGIAVSPDGGLAVVVGGPTVSVWNAATGAAVGSFDTGRDNTGVTFSPDGTCVAVADGVNGAVVWDLTRRSQRHSFRISGWEDGISGLAYAPDGKTLIGAARLSPVLWNLGGLSADNEDDE